jgi:uncharacterized protein (TIGR02722 family)
MRIIMRKNLILAVIWTAFFIFFSACNSGPTRTSGQEDLSGDWNLNDVKQVCETLIESCLNDPYVNEAIDELGRPPRVMIGSFRNETSDHGVDTAVISGALETALRKSRKMRFVAAGAAREELRAERQDQQGNASEETAARLGYETAAEFQLRGAVRDNKDKDRSGSKTSLAYIVRVELINIETGDQLWVEQENIYKTIVTPRLKF